jgi:hypothetical protein
MSSSLPEAVGVVVLMTEVAVEQVAIALSINLELLKRLLTP